MNNFWVPFSFEKKKEAYLEKWVKNLFYDKVLDDFGNSDKSC